MMDHGQKVLTALRTSAEALPVRQQFPVRSWSRCLVEYGLEPGRARELPFAGHREINDARDMLEEKLTLAYEELDFLFTIVGRVGYSVTLTNAEGLTLAERADRYSKHYVDTDRPGSIWTERYAGTNGVGTCLRDAAITSVYLDEHYFEDFIDMSCAAVPLFAPDSTLWAALNISIRNPRLSVETHALALEVVRKSAERLSESIFRHQFRGHTILRLWLPDGHPCLLAVDADHAVVGADAAARQAFNLPKVDFTPFSLWRLFVRNPKAIHNRADSPVPLELTRLDGSTVQGMAVAVPSPKLFAPSASASALGTAKPPARPPLPEPAAERRVTMDDWAGSDQRMVYSVNILRRLAHTGLPILILGETGVGKDTLARAWHAESPRSAKPFIALNCAAMPETLIESELFGYAGGAFTGARKEGSAGRFVQADGGTLFLDEIGDMPLQLQTRLLRVLESGEVAPLGSGKIRRVDVQFIAATNQKLEQRIAAGAFREDLYYRLAGVVLDVPALAERSDMALVIDRCVADLAGRRGIGISHEARALLLEHRWPGNLRELSLVVNRAACLATGDLIRPEDLLLGRSHGADAVRPATAPRPAARSEAVGIRARVDEAERSAILEAINACGGDVAAAAKTLGMSRATLYRRIKAHGLSSRN